MEKILDKQRKFFATGETRTLAYRIKMLKTLRRAILAFEQDISDALHRDLNKPKLDAYATEIGQCLAEITFVLKHLKAFPFVRRLDHPGTTWSISYSVSVELSFRPCGLAPHRLSGGR